MSTRQSAYAELASSTSSPFPGPPSEPIPPLPTRSYTDPLKPKPLPPALPHSSVSLSDLSCAQREPSVDPRKARRHCAHFGFRREPLNLAALTIATSVSSEDSLTSPGPTPPGTFTSTESDASSFNDLPFDFPQPPPISPMLRRMKSSPLFTLADTGSIRDLSTRKRWGAIPAVPAGQLWKNTHAVDSLTDLEAELDFSPPFGQSESYRGRIDGLTKELQSVIQDDTLFDDVDPPLPPWIAHGNSDTLVPFLFPAASKSSLVLESRHLPTTPETTTPKNVARPILPRQISKMRSLKFAPECSSSLERLDVSIQPSKPSSKSLFRGRSISMDFHKSRPRPVSAVVGGGDLHSSNPPSSYLPNMGRLRGPQRVSTDPVINKHHTMLNVNRERNYSLSTPFLHRPVNHSTPTRPHRHPHASMSAPSPGLKSFIDITPEQVRRKGSLGGRDRMKKLLSRASQVFDWKKKRTNLAH
ncbi:hypothetical protein BT96DRAFT_1018042 [Gymnopus androsaceus JB14]|uniref:Uncharacterized protein n=1 Tax=Gymnopus androsaceus JB14 TaxID=1447944 RepID=A0A6A4HUF7_9AGAR|nr:hypothetical protein BT96DRAFT_1018042 [Gymnopus androsaceus JB14]